MAGIVLPAGLRMDETSAAVDKPMEPPNAIRNISGFYPHLAVFSDQGEIGIGAVASWAGKLWFVTYPPHMPNGGPDKLWTVDSNLVLSARPESRGGTHASRFIHPESRQLILGPYFIDAQGHVRAISAEQMPGRLTGVARHLTDPSNRVYIASMEEGLYAVNVNSLKVEVLRPDSQSGSSQIPGTHGKGLYSGQGRLLYANNGESGWSLAKDPGFNAAAGALVENNGADFLDGWKTIERKCFTEITGPGGISGSAHESAPLWAIGWDKRSVLLKLLERGTWHNYRLPKGSYTHDAFHGWYTEWPRIREVTDGQLLMHMHGLFYHFPKEFSQARTGGLKPICTYLRMPVDYCEWNGQLVMGQDVTSTTGGNIWAGQSHSAPWFGQLRDLQQWGAPAGFGGPWKDDPVTAGTPSESFLVAGFQQRVLHLKHSGAQALGFHVEYDARGDGSWTALTNLMVPAHGYQWCRLPLGIPMTWIRLTPSHDASGVTAYFHLANAPVRPQPGLFAGIANITDSAPGSGGILRPKNGDARTLEFAATITRAGQTDATRAYYEIDGALQLRRTTNATAEAALRTNFSLAKADFTVDAASVLVKEGTNRFRLPKSHPGYDAAFSLGWPRGKREVITERDLFNAHGTFYELPKSSSGGFRRIRPVTTHLKRITDFGSWRGLLVLAGLSANATADQHVFRSDDGLAGLWLGDVDDLWRLGPPSGNGGPWKDTPTRAGIPSDPYLFYGYSHKAVELSHQSGDAVTFLIEVDFAADNTWSPYLRISVPPGQKFRHEFPEGYSAHWIRIQTGQDTTATATFDYTP